MDQTSPCIVSIITPTYNREKLLPETIDSVLAQSCQDWEMLIIDDGSTDGTRQLVEKYTDQDRRIRYFWQPNQGADAARNNCVHQTKGKYLAFLDSDDRYFPGALGHLISAIESARPNVKLVYGDFVIIDDATGTRQAVTATPPQPRPLLYFQFLSSGGNPILTSAAIIEKAAMVEIGLFDPQYKQCGDLELWTRLIPHYDIEKVPQQICFYRKHVAQMSKDHGGRRYWRDRIIFKFFQTFTADLKTLFPKCGSEFEMAMALDDLARMMLARPYTSFDTALYLLKLAERMNHSLRRKRLIAKLETEIPHILRDEYQCEMRVTL